MRTVIHEARNHLAVAVANLEAFADGKLEPNESRLRAVLQALNELDVLMGEPRLAERADMRGDLAVAVANIEAFVEQRLELTAARLRTVLDVLYDLGARLNDLPVGDEVDAPAAMESRLETIDVCRLIENETTAIEATAREKNVGFTVQRCAVTDYACSGFFGDPVRIGQIVKNVLLNAIRYTPEGGDVEVDCRRSAGELAFTVRDGGPGIPRDEIERIFERGFRGKAAASQPGSGIGLALVKRFVEEHHGTIDVTADESGGSTFVVHLPGRPAAENPCSGCSHAKQKGQAFTASS